ncbi:hypothetical protein ACS0TY_009722 [Phlomoides rotata]
MKIRLGGDEMWVPITYESLPNYCFCYGSIGHQFRSCDSYDRNQCLAPSEIEYGHTIKAAILKKSKGPKSPIKFYEKPHFPMPTLPLPSGREKTRAPSSTSQIDTMVKDRTSILVTSPTLKLMSPALVAEQPSIQTVRNATSVDDITASLDTAVKVGEIGAGHNISQLSVGWLKS